MKTSLSVLVVGCLLLPTNASQAAIISVTDAMGSSTISITEGTPTVDVYVRIAENSDDMMVTDISLATLVFVVGDGGPDAVGGMDDVPITAVSHLGTGVGVDASVWQTESGNLASFQGPALPTSSATSASISTIVPTNVSYATPGVLAVFTLDTSGLTAGQTDSIGTIGGFLLDLDSSLVASQTFAQRFIGMGMFEDLDLSFASGRLTVSAIPEPGSFLLLSFGAASVFAGRRYRRRTRAVKESAA